RLVEGNVVVYDLDGLCALEVEFVREYERTRELDLHEGDPAWRRGEDVDVERIGRRDLRGRTDRRDPRRVLRHVALEQVRSVARGQQGRGREHARNRTDRTKRPSLRHHQSLTMCGVTMISRSRLF